MLKDIFTFTPIPKATKFIPSMSDFISVRIPLTFLFLIRISLGHFITAFRPACSLIADTTATAAIKVNTEASFGGRGGFSKTVK